MYFWGIPGQCGDQDAGAHCDLSPAYLPLFPQLPLRPPLSQDCRDLLQRLLERDPGRRISFQEFFTHPWVDLEHMPSGESLARAVSRPTGMGWSEGRLGVSSMHFGGEQVACPTEARGWAQGICSSPFMESRGWA